VVEAGAVLDLTEAFIDRGAVAEPRCQPDVVPVVGGDVGDDEADRPDVVCIATEGEGELVLRTVRRRRDLGSALSCSTLILTRRMIV